MLFLNGLQYHFIIYKVSSQSVFHLLKCIGNPFCSYFYLFVTHSLSIWTKGSRRRAAKTAGPVCLLINGINHLALQGLFILKMNYLKVQHNAVSFLLLPHYCSGRLETHQRPSSFALLSHHPSIFSCRSNYSLHVLSLRAGRDQGIHNKINRTRKMIISTAVRMSSFLQMDI